MTKAIRAGDSYQNLQGFFLHELVDNTGKALDLSGCEVRTSYRAKDTSENQIEHVIEVGEDGDVVTSVGLELVGLATQGILKETLTSTETRSLPVGGLFMGDLQITKGDDVVTFDIDETFTVISDLSKEVS